MINSQGYTLKNLNQISRERNEIDRDVSITARYIGSHVWAFQHLCDLVKGRLTNVSYIYI